MVDQQAEQELHKRFAVDLNRCVWRLLEKETRSWDEEDEMLHAAHASAYHWNQVGTPSNAARAHWLIARVYAVLNRTQSALYHARRSLEICQNNELVDFDLAYAYEGMARAYAAAGQKTECLKYRDLAQQAGEEIRREADKKLFVSDFSAEPWFNMR